MLSALGRDTLAGLRFPLAGLTQARGARIAARGGPARRIQGREPGPVLPRGRGKARVPRAPRRPGRPARRDRRRRRGASSDRHRGHHHFTVGQRRGIGIGAPEPLYVLATDAASNRVVVGPREQLATERVRVREATLHRPGGRVDRVTLRYRSRAIACSVGRSPPGSTTSSRSTRRARLRRRPGPDRVPDGRRPGGRPRHDRGQTPRLPRREDRRDPRGLSGVLRGAGPPARALGLAGPAPGGHLHAADRRGDAAVQALFPRRGGAAPAIASSTRRSASARPTSREVGNTRRHLTFFEMLGNWSFGDYFKEESIAWGLELSVDVFGLDRDPIWVSVFGGDEELGLGPDTEAIEIWKANGIPEERIVQLPRSENFWQGGLDRPLRPLRGDVPRPRRGVRRARRAPGRRHRPLPRVLEPRLHDATSWPRTARSAPLPENNIDTGMGLERMAAILQGVESVFETDSHRPLIELAEELSGTRYDEDAATTRSMRIVADHARGATFLIADGVVPSNEERGYVLRRVLRRAIQQGRTLGLDPALARLVRGAHDRDDVRRLPGAGRSSARRSCAGSPPRRRASAARSTAARSCSRSCRRREGEGDLLDRRGGGVQAPRHLRLSVRPDQGAARRGGPLGGRRRLRGADGGAARACALRRRPAAAAMGTRRCCAFARVGPADRLRRLREPARADERGRGGARRRGRRRRW